MLPRSMTLAGAFLLIAVLGRPAALPGQETSASRPVTLHILVPQADAQLAIEGRATKTNGSRRDFVSPPLSSGKKFTYTLQAVWQPNNYTTVTRTREVPVAAGQEVEVDLRQADPKQPDRIVIRFVPTPPEVVRAMVKLAGVGADDVVYDLGCGDGRMVLGAVQAGAKRGVGVDLDPQRIAESRAAARRAGLEDRVEFRQGDVLDIKDLSDATVVLLYMSDAMNLRLRPILQKSLRPGARIVSHRFTMGDWKPAASETITGANGLKYDIHLWKVGEAAGKE